MDNSQQCIHLKLKVSEKKMAMFYNMYKKISLSIKGDTYLNFLPLPSVLYCTTILEILHMISAYACPSLEPDHYV